MFAENYRFCPTCGGRLEPRVLKQSEPPRLVCEACGFVFYLDPKLAAGMVVEQAGGVVMVRRAIEPRYGAWVFPGGFVDRGEHPEQAAVREAHEEAGLQVRVTGLLGIYTHPPGSPTVLIVYRGEITGGRLEALDESLEAATFAPPAIPWPELAFATTRLAMADYVRLYGLEPPPGEAPTTLLTDLSAKRE